MSDAVHVQAALAEGYLRKGEYRAAEDAARRALEAEPEDTALHRFLALALLGQARYDEAAESAFAIVEETPEDADAVRLLGEALLRGGEPGAARAVLRRAVRLEPEERRGRTLLARADISVSSSSRRRDEFELQEAEVYDRLGWEVEEADPDPSTVTLEIDELDLEELGDVETLAGSELVADEDIEEEVPAEAAQPVLAGDSSEVDLPGGGDTSPEQVVPSLAVSEPRPVYNTWGVADAPPEAEIPTQTPLGADSEAPSDLLEEIPELEPDLEEPPDLLGDDEATREIDMALYAPHPPKEEPPARPVEVTVIPPRTAGPARVFTPTSPTPAAAPAPPPASDTQPSAESGPAPGPLPEVPSSAPVTPIVRLRADSWLRSPVLLLIPVAIVIAAATLLLAVHLRATRRAADRADQARRALLAGRDTDYGEAVALLDATLAEDPDHTASATLAALAGAARAYELSADVGEAERRLEQSARLAPSAAETCAARAYLALRALHADEAHAALVACNAGQTGDPFVRYTLGRALMARGDTAGAAAQLDSVRASHPGMVAALVARAELHAQLGDYETAAATLQGVTDGPAPPPQALMAKARIGLDAGGDPAAAETALAALRARLAELAPGRRAWLAVLEARRLRELGQHAAAAARLLEGLALNVQAPAFLLAAADEAATLWRAEEAGALLAKAQAAGLPGEPLAVPRARVALLRGRPERALELLKAAAADAPAAHLLRAHAQLRLGKLPAARRALLAAADLPDAAVLGALLAHREGRTDEALATLRARAAGLRDVFAVTSLARILLEQGDIDACQSLLARSLAVLKDHPELRIVLGEVHLRAGRARLAEAELRKALALAPGSAPARLGLARSLLASGDLAGAETTLAPILAERDVPARARLLRAELLLAQRRIDQAREELGKATGAGASGVAANRVAGRLALAERRPGRAVELLRAAVEAAPGDEQLRLELAQAFLGAGKIREAREGIRELLRTDPDHPEARLVAGQALMELEYDLEAIGELKRAHRAAESRGRAPIQRARILSTLALGHYHYGEYGKALVILDDAQALHAALADVYLYRGMAFDKLERPERARKQYAQALELDEGLAEAYYRYGASLMAGGGAKEKAAAHLRRYLALAPTGRHRARARELLGER